VLLFSLYEDYLSLGLVVDAEVVEVVPGVYALGAAEAVALVFKPYIS